MKLLTDGSEKDSILGFCLAVISRHAENWPPPEEVLAKDFVNWLGATCFLTRDAMRELCLSKGINLSFVSLPKELHGFNCSFHDKKEIVLSEPEIVPFAHLHTLFHEFREMLERAFVELGHTTLAPQECLETKAEGFAIVARIETGMQEMPAYFEMACNIDARWYRYCACAFLGAISIAYLCSCVFLPESEEIISESRRQRYVRA